ncbi:MAG: polyprenyl synthetase family protein [Phycisphaerales bacterium JB063]
MPTRDDTTTTLPTDAELIARVDDRLRRFVEQMYIPANLRDAITYALFGGGKRIRPLLCLRSCIACGGTAADAVSAAGAVELIHCFSLVHDDLPAMDDDDLRRGRATLHRHTSEAMAILAGDAMTATAFHLLAQGHDDPKLAQQLTHVLASSTNAMIAGQVYDTMGGFDATETRDDLDKLREVHRCKTGALLQASCYMGALCAKATPEQTAKLVEYATAVGLMFQAVDDLLDVTQSTEQVGKQTGKDAAAGKLTYPSLLGVEGTRAEVAKLLDQSLAALEPLGPPAEPLRQLARTLAHRTR